MSSQTTTSQILVSVRPPRTTSSPSTSGSSKTTTASTSGSTSQPFPTSTTITSMSSTSPTSAPSTTVSGTASDTITQTGIASASLQHTPLPSSTPSVSTAPPTTTSIAMRNTSYSSSLLELILLAWIGYYLLYPRHHWPHFGNKIPVGVQYTVESPSSLDLRIPTDSPPKVQLPRGNAEGHSTLHESHESLHERGSQKTALCLLQSYHCVPQVINDFVKDARGY
ncbi:hypothetical protein BDZ45DRAFT_754878 [Acephala macrosclerotiorum]|nr:hypothetical protein BDZ45DRAFT_754878 [Acephala macrosclerotiorum]